MAIKVFDFFAGCGGTSRGFQDAGMDIVLALDNNPEAYETFKTNFRNSEFLLKDITKVSTKTIEPLIKKCKKSPLLFCGCAPCQPFSRQKTKKPSDDRRVQLLDEFSRFVKAYKPDYVFIENVPGIQKTHDLESPFSKFLSLLNQMKYKYDYKVVFSQSYGVPQTRRRLVLLATRRGEITLPPETHGPDKSTPYSTVREWIEDLPHIEAGEEDLTVPNHRAARLSELNKKRIASTPEGGNRLKWEKSLQLKCHTGKYKGHTDVYGRMKWDEPATGLTTRCISLSNGRFGHPEQNRAISVREAAYLQTFPKDFLFKGNLNSMACQIGNAVPVLLATTFGKHVIKHLQKSRKKKQKRKG